MIDVECLYTDIYVRAYKNVRAADCGRVNFRFVGPWTGGCGVRTHTREAIYYVCAS